MSLQVWLPLNGSLENKGLDSNITFYNNSGATIDSNGKIGTCYYFDGTDDWINFNINKHDYENKSICLACWFKSNLIDTNGVLIDIAADICLSFLYSTSGIRFGYWRCYTNSKGNRAGDGSYITPYYDATKWHHIVYISNKSINTLYVDGEFAASVDKSNLYTNYWIPLLPDTTHIRLNIGRSSGDLSWCGGYINDVRVYDHCLSAKEIKEISKGLILHYKLDNNGKGNDNILINTNFNNTYTQTTGWDTTKNGTLLASNWGGYNGGVANASTVYHAHLKELNNEYIYEYIRTADETWLGISQGNLNTKLIAGQTYTFSWEEYHIEGTNRVGTGLYYYKTGATSANFHLGILLASNVTRVIGLWQKFSYTFVAPSDADYSKNMSWYIYGHYNGNGTFYMRHPKLEVGKSVTPWMPHPNDNIYSLYNDNIIYDSSGYEHNSNIKNELTISSDTPKYSLSTHFVDGSYLISPWTILGVISSDALTASIWVKYDSTPPSHHWAIFSCTQSSGFGFAATGDKLQFWVYCANVGYRTATSTVLMSSLIGSWHMLTGTCDRQNVKLYLDNDTEPIATIAWDSTNLIGLATTVPLVIGGEAKGSTTQAEYSDFTGSLSDARIYATALSSEDILELYRTGASIDNKGNIYARELIEE